MLNTFPGLLTYGFFAPTLLRLAVAIVFFYIAWQTYTNRKELAETKLPVVGKAAWAIWFALIVEILIALALLFGYYTQIAALVGAVAALKYIFLKNRIGKYALISRTASFFILMVCLSLLLSGAGALAIDLPL